MSAIDSDFSYRNSSMASASGTTNKTSGTGNTYNAVFSDKGTNELTADDFLQLMVQQLKNQDFMNPLDDSQYLSQLAQFSSMQQMKELAEYSKSNYVMSLIGKNVTVANISVSGTVNKDTGPVEKVSLVDNEYRIYVNGTSYTLNQIMEINQTTSGSDGGLGVKNKSVTAKVTGTDVTLSWPLASSSDADKDTLKYSVYYSKNSNMTTVDDVLANGILLGKENRTALTGEEIKGLDPDTTYFANVIVTDSDNNKYVYQRCTFRTESV